MSEAAIAVPGRHFFCIDEGPVLEGELREDRGTWNGFAMPLFAKDEALTIAKASGGTDLVIAYSEETNTFYVLDTSYVQEEMDVCNAPIDPVHAQTILIGHTAEPLEVFDFGNLGWCWTEVEKPANI